MRARACVCVCVIHTLWEGIPGRVVGCICVWYVGRYVGNIFVDIYIMTTSVCVKPPSHVIIL